MVLLLMEAHGPESPGAVRLTQKDLGQSAGTTRESVNRVLRAFAEEGLITFARGYLAVLRPDALRALAAARG